MGLEAPTQPTAREIESEAGHLVVELTVPQDLYILEDHFPGRPVIPGVVLVQWVFDYGRNLMPEHQTYTIPSIKFSRPVVPGRSYLLTIDLNGSRMNFRYEMGDQTYSTGEILFESQ